MSESHDKALSLDSYIVVQINIVDDEVPKAFTCCFCRAPALVQLVEKEKVGFRKNKNSCTQRKRRKVSLSKFACFE